MVAKPIFAVLYMHFISYFYVVIIHLYVVLPKLEEIYATSAAVFTKNLSSNLSSNLVLKY